MAENELSPQEANIRRISEIRSIALAELLGKEGSLDPWPYYGELVELKRRPLTTEWLEASIMVSVIGRIRPAKVVGYLKKLRDKRIKQDQHLKFETFDASLRTYLYPERLTNHGYDRQTFADLDHADIWNAVRDHLSVLSDQGYQVFLNSGTLLGVIRDQALIEHDDDIDLAVILKATNQADAIAEWKTLRKTLEDAGIFDHDNHKQDAIYKLKPAGATQIDLFPAWQQDGNFYVYPHTHGQLQTTDVLPLQTCAITGHDIPADPQKMLTLNYGEGWQHPDPLFKFPWADANARFAPFLEGLSA